MASRRKRCFIISPIGGDGTEIRENMNTVRKYIIDKACSKKEYHTTRADEISEPGTITNQIIERLISDDLVIADLSGNNPNVCYELAVRHSVQKPVILLSGDKPLKIPFDVAAQRVVQYTLHPKDVEEAINEIEKQIDAIEASNFTVDSPITTKIYLPKKDASSSDLMLQEILSIIRNISGEVKMLKESRDMESEIFPYLSEKEKSIVDSIKAMELQKINEELHHIGSELERGKRGEKLSNLPQIMDRMNMLVRKRELIEKSLNIR